MKALDPGKVESTGSKVQAQKRNYRNQRDARQEGTKSGHVPDPTWPWSSSCDYGAEHWRKVTGVWLVEVGGMLDCAVHGQATRDLKSANGCGYSVSHPEGRREGSRQHVIATSKNIAISRIPYKHTAAPIIPSHPPLSAVSPRPPNIIRSPLT